MTEPSKPESATVLAKQIEDWRNLSWPRPLCMADCFGQGRTLSDHESNLVVMALRAFIQQTPVQQAQDMARLSASEVACYRWREDTAEHRAMRVAFMDGARTAMTVTPHDGDLKSRILQYAHDLRHNASGGDDYPWKIMAGVADYLEVLVSRSQEDKA